MTRFARARGSKASNEKAPEDSTPWEVMKEQLLSAKKDNEEAKLRSEAEKQRIENYENFLKERKTQKRKATWCEFPEDKNQNDHSQKIQSPMKKKQKKINTDKKNELNKFNELNQVVENCSVENEAKIKDIDESASKRNEIDKPDDAALKKNKKKKNKKNKIENQKVLETDSETKVNSNENTVEEIKTNIGESKKKKKNKKPKQKQTEVTEINNKNVINENNDSTVTDNNNKLDNSSKQINKNNNVKKQKKLVDGKPVRRKEINDKSFQLIINGKEVVLVRFDGFPIMKKDAERLEDLRKSMLNKGIPKSEVQRTLKLERRRAEKALARLKREVCYNCRKGGHNLSDCPELKSKIPGVNAAEGVCFKCGSTEHRQFECKVQRDKEFRFATCFICKEPGHIARQCPDNPKGLYPNGGNCKLCGDVTHLRKDCPTVNEKKEETSVKLQTFNGDDDLEGIGQSKKNAIHEETTKKPKKIKF